MPPMADLANEFSWSRSRDATFHECRRRYFYQYYGAWGGWETTAPEAVLARHEPRVGHGVAGPREKVCQSHGLAHLAGQDGEREVEAPAHVAEQRTEDRGAPRGATSAGGHGGPVRGPPSH